MKKKPQNIIIDNDPFTKKKRNLKPLTDEIWKPIAITNNRYEISNYGRLRRHRPKGNIEIVKTHINNGFVDVTIRLKDKTKKFLIQRLVAEHFIPKDNVNQIKIIHIDGNLRNNHYLNLKWITQKEFGERVSETVKKNNFVAHTKYSVDDIIELKKMINKGVRPVTIMKLFRISETQFYRIKNGVSWGHVNIPV